MFGIGFSELILILVVALVVFGPDKLPEVGKTMGKTVKEFKSAVNRIDSEIKKEVNTVSEAAGMSETIKDLNKDLKQAEGVMKGFDKELKDINSINPLKNEINDLNKGLKQAENIMKGFDKELKDINSINPLKSTASTDTNLPKTDKANNE